MFERNVLFALLAAAAALGFGRGFLRRRSIRASVPVSAAMLHRVHAVSPDQRIEVAAALMLGGAQSQIPVIDHGRTVGVLTRADVASALAAGGPDAMVGAAPTHPAVAVEPTDSLETVFDALRRSPDAVVVVLDHGEPVGLATSESLTAYLASYQTQRAA